MLARVTRKTVRPSCAANPDAVTSRSRYGGLVTQPPAPPLHAAGPPPPAAPPRPPPPSVARGGPPPAGGPRHAPASPAGRQGTAHSAHRDRASCSTGGPGCVPTGARLAARGQREQQGRADEVSARCHDPQVA